MNSTGLSSNPKKYYSLEKKCHVFATQTISYVVSGTSAVVQRKLVNMRIPKKLLLRAWVLVGRDAHITLLGVHREEQKNRSGITHLQRKTF